MTTEAIKESVYSIAIPGSILSHPSVTSPTKSFTVPECWCTKSVVVSHVVRMWKVRTLARRLHRLLRNTPTPIVEAL
jgi:hypothetical protein